jgi:malate dehydrogenase (oxaloacetate-decarboxylating)(NADP+)
MKPKVLPHTDLPRGVELLHDPVFNKGTAFTADERKLLDLSGLLPPRVHTQAEQVQRVMANIRAKHNDLERYIFLIGLQDRNENLFYRTILDHIDELMPIIYTPTVGMACQLFGHLFRRPRGLYITLNDRGRVAEILANWPSKKVAVIVVTDGERILGLGDLGADGMGIPVGKLSLYTACAGIDPTHCLPITLDVGTNNQELLDDPLYLGLPQRRVHGPEYDALVDELIRAAQVVFPDVLIQLEDFATTNAFKLLARYRQEVCLFDDDIQGTASVALSGVYSALRITGRKITDQQVLFLGTGEAGIGIGDLLVSSLMNEGLTLDQARHHCWFFDSKGLVTAARKDLAAHKLPFAHNHEPVTSLLDAVNIFKPTILIGVSGQPGLFDQSIVEKMAELNERPIIFALSNPTSKSECTAEQAYTWSQGRAIFASGSPFEPVEYGGKTLVPGQGNNAYIFPGVGLGVSFCKARSVTNEMFLKAAVALADEVSEQDLDKGRIYPSLGKIRDVSAAIAYAVVTEALNEGLSNIDWPDNVLAAIRQTMYTPEYPSYVQGWSDTCQRNEQK